MEYVLCIGTVSVVGFLGYAAHRYLFHKPSLKEYRHPYKEPGYGYYLKCIFCFIQTLLFKVHKKRFNHVKANAKDPMEVGIFPSELQENLEKPQNVQSPNDMDEVSFFGVNPKTEDVLNVCLAKRNGFKCEAAISFIVNVKGTRKQFELPQFPRTLYRNKQDEGNCWTCNDLKIWNLRSLGRWRVSFNGLMREKTSNEISHVVFNFVWSSYSRVIDHKDILPIVRAKASALSDALDLNKHMDSVLDQYDQWGSFDGSYMINDEPETEMILFGSKIRRTGQLRYSDIHRFIQIKGYVEDGSSFSINAVNIPNKIPEMVWGYVELSGSDRHLLKSSDFELERFKDTESSPDFMSIRIKTDGDEYIVDLKCHNGAFTHVWGSDEELKAKCNNLKVCLTSMEHGLRLNGSGMVCFLSENDLLLESPTIFPPMLVEPNVVNEQVTSKNFLEFSDEYCKSSKLVGGKGSSLAMLKQIKSDAEVPDGFCITVSANNRHIEENEALKKKIVRISKMCCGEIISNTEEECKSLGRLFEETDLSAKFTEELRQKLIEQFGSKFENVPFGVRSSAIGEDGEEMSAAGQMETVLGCKGLQQILQGIKKCWASCFGFRAVEYRRQNGQPIYVGMGVVVQQMVPADKAGVLFTRDPVTGNPAVISIAANYGIGESVVSAMSEPDTIVVTRTFDNQMTLSQITIGKKKLIVKMKDDGGVEESQISEEDMKSCCLSTEEAMKLAELGLLVELSYGNPRDIEWAINKGKIYLLQARPITNLHNESEYFLKNELNSPLVTDSECYTAGNIKEVFPGAQSTLSLSLMSQYFVVVLLRFDHNFCASITSNPIYDKTFFSCQNNLFNVRGNMSYIQNRKRTGKQREQIVKRREGHDIAFNGRIIDDGDLERRCIDRYGYEANVEPLKELVFGIYAYFTSKGQMKKTKEKYLNYQMSFDHCKSNEEIAHYLKTSFEPYVESMYAHLMVTIMSMELNTDILMFLLGESPEYTQTHYGDFALLMSIESGDSVESADVPTALQILAKEITEKFGSEKFLEMSKEEGENFLTSQDSPVKECYEDFIRKHGHRCVKEFDIQSKTWSMEPSKLVDPLKAMIRTKDKANCKKLTIDEALERLQTKTSTKDRKKLREQVLQAREYVGLREEAKSLLIRSIDHIRQQWRKFGRKLVHEGRLPDDELIFFMTVQEVEELVKTRSAKIIQRAMRRKRLHPQLGKLKFEEVNWGKPKPIDETTTARDRVDGSHVIKGTPVSRGIIEGPAKVVPHVEDAHTIQPGDILVTNATDIAWSPYFPSLSGVITEIGGLISHGAVVAREYGIPCAVGAVNATTIIKSGDSIRLNGNDGTITVMPSQN